MAKISYYSLTFIRLLNNIRNPLVLILKLLVNSYTNKQKVQKVVFRNGTVFFIRNLMDLWILAETYVNQDYQKHSVSLGKDWQILDIGSAFGDFCILASQQAPDGTIYAIEPLPDSYKLLNRNLKINGITNVKAFSIAFANDCSSLNMLQNEKNFGNSQSTKQKATTITVPALSLDDFIKQNGIKRFDLIKSDCEGAEFDIFLNLKDSTYQKIGSLVMEYHLFHNDSKKMLEKLKIKLTKNGFYVHLTPNPIHPDIGFLYATTNKQPSPESES